MQIFDVLATCMVAEETLILSSFLQYICVIQFYRGGGYMLGVLCNKSASQSNGINEYILIVLHSGLLLKMHLSCIVWFSLALHVFLSAADLFLLANSKCYFPYNFSF